MTAPKCHECGRVLLRGEQAWVSDWKVIEATESPVTVRTETRYTCDDCEAGA